MGESAKPPVVMIPGMWSVPEALDDVKQVFMDEGHEVVVVRLPHHYPKAEMTDERKRQLAVTGVEQYVQALESVIDELNSPPLIIGHSMGGLLAQLIAARRKCAGVILLSSAAPAGINPWCWSALRTFGHNLFRFPLWKSCTDLRLENIRYGIAQTQSPSIQQDIYEMATYESGWVSVQMGFSFLFPNTPIRVESEAIRCPMLIIGGTEDRITPIRIQRQLAEKYHQQAVLHELKGACHWTIGGSYFPEIRKVMLDWVNKPGK